MNKIIVSNWIAPLYCDLEVYLDNADKIILKYKQIKNLPQTIKSVEGNQYTLITDNNKIIGFKPLV
jgi:hypothetical protein